jgi:hypothetical protein
MPFAAAAAIIFLIGIGIEKNWNGTSNDYAVSGDDTRIELPIVESVDDPNITVMTFQTDDPHITIAWFFDENPGTERR